jgi:hypothetical protein
MLAKCDINDMHHITNGLQLCSNCQGQFDSFKVFVEVSETDHFFIPSVNLNDTEQVRQEYYLRARRKRENVVEPDKGATLQELCSLGKLELPGSPSNQPPKPEELPNKLALKYHKAACLIWQMAGGADPEEDSDDEESAEDLVMDLIRGEELSFEEKMRRVSRWMAGSS